MVHSLKVVSDFFLFSFPGGRPFLSGSEDDETPDNGAWLFIATVAVENFYM